MLLAGSEVACDHLAVEVLRRDAYEALAARVEAHRVPVVDRGRLEAGVEDAIRFVAPGGFVIEAFYGMAHVEPAAYHSSAPKPRRFEHLTVKSSHKPELEELLVEVVGLRLSDRAEDAASWLRASDEHHGVSVIGADVDALHHYAWQYEGFGAFARIGDHLMDHGRRFLWGPGHHGIGDNYFCYAFDGDGVVVEYSAGMQRIDNDESYRPRVWPDEPLTVNRWGNPPPPPEFQDAATPLAELVSATP
jgi:hypothetical protein